MLDKVFIVENYDFECDEIIAVCASLELAEEKAKEHMAEYGTEFLETVLSDLETKEWCSKGSAYIVSITPHNVLRSKHND